MALKKAGIQLTVEGYSEYMRKLRDINKQHREAFSSSNTKINEAKKDAQQAAPQVSRLGSAFGSAATLVKGFAVALVAVKLKAFAMEATNLAARVETLGVSLQEVGQNVGYTREQIDYAVASLKDQGITTQAAQQSLLRMARANIEFSEAAKLAAIAQGSAVVAGMNSSQAFERLVTGIQKAEPELLDELGIQLNRTVAYKKLADQLGINATKLTQAQKQQAILNEIYAQSEVVLGVYDKAMDTAGKKEGSLARYREEAMLGLGQALLPLKDISIDIQTSWWKGVQQLTKGLSLWGEMSKSVIKSLKFLKSLLPSTFSPLLTLVHKLVGDTGGMFETMGRGAQDWLRVIGEFTALVIANIKGVGKALQEQGVILSTFAKKLAGVAAAVASGNFGLAVWISEGMVDSFKQATADSREYVTEEFQRLVDDLKERFPLLYTPFDQLGQVEEVDLTRKSEAADAVAEMTAELEAQIAVWERLGEIEQQFTQSIENAEKSRAKALEQLAKDVSKARKDAYEGYMERQKSIEERAAKDRERLIKEHNKSQQREIENYHNNRLAAERRFQLNLMQAQRRFSVSERRLRAEGDILGLMELRENHELAQQEAKENFELGQQEEQDRIEQAKKQRQDDLNDQLAQLKESVGEQQREAREAYREQLNDLTESMNERRDAIQKEYEEQIRMAEENRRKATEELGKSLQEQAEITEEGMKNITQKMDEVFGENGMSDALFRGWKDRTKSTVEQAISDIQAEIGKLQNMDFGMDEARANKKSSHKTKNKAHDTIRPTRPLGMRQGGVGVVRGPALFEVEPGVKEFVQFVPLGGASGPQNINVNMSGGFDIKGGEQAGRAAVTEAVNVMTDEFILALKRLGRRN